MIRALVCREVSERPSSTACWEVLGAQTPTAAAAPVRLRSPKPAQHHMVRACVVMNSMIITHARDQPGAAEARSAITSTARQTSTEGNGKALAAHSGLRCLKPFPLADLLFQLFRG